MNNTSQSSIEIMSPVGSYESLWAAIQGGADSIYFGVGSLNMRAQSSANFTLDDLAKISTICQENKIKSYLTLNTIIYNHELDLMKEVLNAALQNKISAVIASDLAVITYAHQIGLEVHISTQCNITNIEAVRFFSRYADVMVTARELSLEQVKQIILQIEIENIRGPKGNLIEIEVFAHGALCMAVSGKCYLSLDHYNKSANRGSCLQLCRRPYKVTDLDGENELLIDNKYILSPKDLKTLDFIDKIVQAGVKVLKIEGRGRSADYVKTVTRVYKEATLSYLENSLDPQKIQVWNQALNTVYNRGFWSGYYMGKTLGEWTKNYGSQASKRKIYVGKITNFFQKINVAEIKMESHDLEIGNQIIVTGETTGVYEDTLTEIRVDLKSTPKTIKGELASIPTHSILRRGDKVYKLVDSELI